MFNLNTIPKELAFLNDLNGDKNDEYRSSQWLTTTFDSEIWKFDFGTTHQLVVDFQVKLDDGSFLTDHSNFALLDIFKCWICIQTHFDVTGTVIQSASTANATIRRVLSLIDYLLINSEYFQLSKFGLTNLTENDIIHLLTKLASSREITTSIYEWPAQLSDFLRNELASTETQILDEVIQKNPFIALDIPDEEDRMLSLTESEIVYSRAYLWNIGFYRPHFRDARGIETFRYGPNTKKLADKIYSDTLRGYTQKPQPYELLLEPTYRSTQECARAPVRHKSEDILAEREWHKYRKTLRTLGQLAEIGVNVPLFALSQTKSLYTQENFLLQTSKRFRTLPHNIVLYALRNAIEFALDYGDDLIKSAEAVIEASRKSNTSCVTFTNNNDVKDFLTPKIREMGVKFWHLSSNIKSEKTATYQFKKNTSPTNIFNRLRNNEGLYDLIRVLYGAIQISLGALMARRQGELIDLISGEVLDVEKSNLVFFNRKSGFGDMRSKEARPIPPVLVNLVEMLEQFHRRLVTIGVSTKKAQLFSYPDLNSGNPIMLNSPQYNASIDIFCDYFEMPLNENGERYYIRQHQLRRFFAMMFFWGGSFGGMDALRWFLGHTDIEHLYHYITESTPGYILQAAKANFGSELIRTHPDEAPKLADILERHFGTRDFSVLDSDELDEYIEELIIEGCVEIEPIFFEVPDGKAYRIAVKVLERTQGHFSE
jgi:hypothetical protein